MGKNRCTPWGTLWGGKRNGPFACGCALWCKMAWHRPKERKILGRHNCISHHWPRSCWLPVAGCLDCASTSLSCIEARNQQPLFFFFSFFFPVLYLLSYFLFSSSFFPPWRGLGTVSSHCLPFVRFEKVQGRAHRITADLSNVVCVIMGVVAALLGMQVGRSSKFGLDSISRGCSVGAAWSFNR